MSSVYAAVDSDEPDVLKIIVTNKQMVNTKDFEIELNSDEFTYELENVFAIDSSDASIYETDIENFENEDNKISFTADTLSVYMLVLRAQSPEDSDISGSVWSTAPEDIVLDNPENSEASSDVSAEETAEGTATETVSEENFDNVPVEPSDETVPDLTDYENHTDTSYEEMSSETEINSESYVSESNNESEGVSDISAEKDSSQKVPLILKILVSLMCMTVIGGMVYVLFFDKNNK